MSASLPASEPSVTAAEPAEHDAYYRGVLHELIELGTDLARAIHREATTAAEPVDATVRFDRVCRCVRRSILLARSLDAPAVVRGSQRAAARRHVLRAVEDRIDRAEEGAEAELLHEELLERLERPELDEDLDTRPVDEVIRDICRDLGIEEVVVHPWKRRTPEDVSLLFERAGGDAARRPDGLRLVRRGRAPPSRLPVDGHRPVP